MTTPSRLLLLSGVFLSVASSVAIAHPPGETRVDRQVAGEYQHLWIRCETGAEVVPIFVGLRGGKSTTVWFVGGAVPGGVKATGAYRVLVDAHALTLNDSRLAGTIAVRQVSVWQPQHLAAVVIGVDAKHAKNEITGTWSSEVVGDKKSHGKITGSLTREATIRSGQAIPTGVDWPNYHGPCGTNGSTDSANWIDDLALAKPVWKAEQPVLSGWGTGVDSRYTWRAAVGTLCGGSSTPVMADGRLYLFHYVPSGEPAADLVTKVLADFERNFKRMPLPAERASLVDYCRPLSDTIVTCIDAQTGGTVWNATFPRLSGNYQTHKWRGFNPTASVIGSTVIANDLAGNWVALDAVKGDVLWIIKTAQKVEKDRAALGAAQAGMLAILPSASGPARAVEPRTGKIVWQQPGGSQALTWGKPGAERILFLSHSAPVCRDAATGQLLWTMPENLVGHTGSAALVEGDLLVGHVLPDPKQRGGFFQGWKLADSGATKVWQDEYLDYDENLTVTLGNGRAYLVGKNEIRCLDLATGKRLGRQSFDETQGPGSNPWLGLFGSRLLLSPEGQHGTQHLQLLDATDLRLIGKPWSPPNNSTTAYAVHSIAYPVIAGRLFVRGMDGLYCYDLRQQESTK